MPDKSYQYKVHQLDYKTADEEEEILCKYGREGWKLVSVVTDDGTTTRAYLVRER